MAWAQPATDPAQRVRPRTWPAAVTLFFLAALIPETVATYNSPPLLLLTRPWAVLFLASFYGSVALLVREFLRRRQAGWVSVLLLGMAAGAVNEGIIAGTWYKAQYSGYTLVHGVDPAVAVGLTTFHALYSTVLPILLAEPMFRHVARDRWLGRRGIVVCAVLLTLTAATGFAPVADRRVKLIVLLGVAILIAVARALPRARPRPGSAGTVPGLGVLRLVGALGTVGYFAVFAIVPGIVGAIVRAPDLGPWQILYAALMSAYFCLVIAVARTWSGRTAWGGARPRALPAPRPLRRSRRSRCSGCSSGWRGEPETAPHQSRPRSGRRVASYDIKFRKRHRSSCHRSLPDQKCS